MYQKESFGSISGLPTIRTQGCKLSNVDPLGTERYINSERIVAADYYWLNVWGGAS